MLGKPWSWRVPFAPTFRSSCTKFISFLVIAGLLSPLAAAHPAEPPRLLDGFEDPESWQVIEADGVELTVTAEPGKTGRSARLDYDFTRGSGYAIIRKEFALDLPENYRFSYAIRGQGPRNTVEFKLVDPTGDNVWWVNTRDFAFPVDWQTIVLPRRKLSFAWGPSGGAPLAQARYIEMVITSFNGGRGTVWLDDLTFEPLPEVRPYAGTPLIRGSSPPDAPARPMGEDGTIDFTSDPADAEPSLTIDFGQAREIGGMSLDWGASFPADYDVLASIDGEAFASVATVHGTNGGRDVITLPDVTARAIRIQVLPGRIFGPISIRAARFLPPEFADSDNNLLEALATDALREWYPRYLRGEATYWTVIGANGDEHEALINEEGAIEVDKLAFSLEPFVFTDGQLVPWDDLTHEQSLEEGSLPIPTVHRAMKNQGLELEVKAFADGPAGASNLYVRYSLRNTGVEPSAGTLFIAARPMQVNPPYQHLNITGGAATVRRIDADAATVRVDSRIIIPLVKPDRFGATTFDGGEIVEHLARGQVPSAQRIDDPRGLGSAAFAFEFKLRPDETKVIGFRVPFHPGKHEGGTTLADLNERLEATRRYWHGLLDRVQIRLPNGNERITDSIRANLAYILINRDGPGIQPGSRSYERTWIRDGALTSTALLSMGLSEYVLEFLDWFAAFQYENGKVPCCVDRRGPDPVPEHDSHGQYIHAVYTYFTFTGDIAFLKRHEASINAAVDYIEFLRDQRMTEEFASGPAEKRMLFGLMPESISHEGYSAKPMHSYWDDFWTLKGLIDAVRIAEFVGDSARVAEYSTLRDSFEKTLYDSMRLAMATRGIDYIPGCAELGDFDATSTTVGLFPCGQLGKIPEPQLEAAFERYWRFFQDRRDDTIEWKDYTPYEHRIIGSMILLGHRDRAHEILNFFFDDQRPSGWRHWAEVVRRKVREPWFIGDMPHTWVGSDFINAMQVMLAYTRDHDQAMILGAGLPRRWLEAPEGIDVGRLRTEFGQLSYSTRAADGVVRIEVQRLEHAPPGGIWFHLPDPDRIGILSIAGHKVDVPSDGLVRLAVFPAAIEVRYIPAGK